MSDSIPPAAVTPLGRGLYLVERELSRQVAYAARVGRTIWVWIDGHVHTVADDADGGRTVRPASHGPADLSAPMPATVVAVDVQPGQAVSRGDTLLRLEAMKMEWPLVAPRDGTVAAVRCAIGDLVQPGVPLVELT